MGRGKNWAVPVLRRCCSGSRCLNLAVTAAIPRTSNPRHMADNVNAGFGPVPDARQGERLALVWENA